MKKYSFSFLVAFLCVCGHSGVVMASDIQAYTVNEYVNAIRIAEGNENYGILSVPCVKGAGCRKICENTVKNNLKRRRDSKSKLGFVEFLGKRYCPVGAKNDPKGLNKNWIKNVNKALKRNQK